MVKQGSTALKGHGVKFGATVRKRYGKVYRTLHKKRRCPSCGSLRFGRVASGILSAQLLISGPIDVDTEKLHV